MERSAAESKYLQLFFDSPTHSRTSDSPVIGHDFKPALREAEGACPERSRRVPQTSPRGSVGPWASLPLTQAMLILDSVLDIERGHFVRSSRAGLGCRLDGRARFRQATDFARAPVDEQLLVLARRAVVSSKRCHPPVYCDSRKSRISASQSWPLRWIQEKP